MPKKARFVRPSIDDVRAYCRDRGDAISADEFFDYYESIGWKVGNRPMSDWTAVVRNWERRSRHCGSHSQHESQTAERASTSYAEKLRDPKWQKKRLRIMERDGFVCVECRDERSSLNVHQDGSSWVRWQGRRSIDRFRRWPCNLALPMNMDHFTVAYRN